jgi:hypothetical protein
MLSIKQVLFLLYAHILKIFYSIFYKHYSAELKVDVPKPVYGAEHKKKFSQSFTESLENNSNIDAEFYNKAALKTLLIEDNNELEKKWKARILFENTPRGNVIMYYDAFKLGFAYYCDQHLPYDVLNTVAMKYVLTYQCRDFFIDEVERPENAPSKIVGLLADDPKKEENKKPANELKSKFNEGPFAKLKSYNTSSAKVESNKKNEKAEPIKDKLRNCFINRGKIANFSFLQKSVKKPVGFKTNMVDGLFANSDVQKEVFSYRDYKAALAKSRG